MAALTCSICGKALVSGAGRSLRGRSYCPTCYSDAIKEIEKQELLEDQFYKYVKNLFNLNDIPAELSYMLSDLTNEGKKIKGIQKTLYYYYEILGHDTSNFGVYILKKIIRENYDLARVYFEKEKEVKEYNDKVDLTTEEVLVTLPDQSKKQRKAKTRIEDL